MNKHLRTEVVRWQAAETTLRQLRRAVFIDEQHVPEELEWDGRDTDSDHVLVYSEDNHPIATGRLLADGRIGRMAVLPAWRGQGAGKAVLARLIQLARARRLPQVSLDAQTQAMGFYERHGFHAEGEVFMDAGILHRRMVLALTNAADAGLPLQGLRLGESRDELYLHSREENRTVALALVQQGMKSLHLFTHDLDPRLYDNAEFIEAVKQLALRSDRSKVYILMQDPRQVMYRGHRIVELARRISSHIFIHRAAAEDQDRNDTFLLVDGVGVLRRPHAARFEGTVWFHNPGEARLLHKDFQEMWERSQPEPELRRLHL